MDEGGASADTYRQEIAPSKDKPGDEKDNQQAADGVGVEFLTGVELADEFRLRRPRLFSQATSLRVNPLISARSARRLAPQRPTTATNIGKKRASPI